MHKSQLNKKQQARLEAQIKAVEKARKILEEVGVKWLFATDEDVLTALEGDSRLSAVMGKDGWAIIESINDRTIDNLMNSWGDSQSYAIDDEISTEGESEAK